MKLESAIASILTWKSGDKRAPHKPLLLLYAIGAVQKNKARLSLFEEVAPVLERALRLFGPAGRTPTAQYPFWRLQHDKLWEVTSERPLVKRKGSDDPSKSSLLAQRARAGFTESYFHQIKASPHLQSSLIHQLLDSHFPASIHEDIVAYFELALDAPASRNPMTGGSFRDVVLTAYGGKCALSDFTIQSQDWCIGIEPSFIKWPQAGGKAIISNAVALSTLHRKLFHFGLFSLDSEYKVRLSTQLNFATCGLNMSPKLEGKKIRLPANRDDRPDHGCLEWHRSEVFRK